jgi:DNA-directed RNA polymerase specialized sigma24 family protein
LARKASSLRRPEALAGWLHGVALRVAAKARTAAYRRRVDHLPPSASRLPDPRPDPLAQLTARELLVAVDEEVQRLPEVYRLPVSANPCVPSATPSQ